MHTLLDCRKPNDYMGISNSSPEHKAVVPNLEVHEDSHLARHGSHLTQPLQNPKNTRALACNVEDLSYEIVRAEYITGKHTLIQFKVNFFHSSYK